VYLCSTPPYLLQTALDRRMDEYTHLVLQGKVGQARKIRASLDPVRQALKSTRPQGKAAAHQKYWQELLGQAGGAVRAPLLELSAEEKAATRAAFEACGLKIKASTQERTAA
jgi:4-hydroxy-tetrahydrodipicolinate synthase